MVSYWELISKNRPFRQLWIAQMISLIGDWFNMVALFYFVSKVVDNGLLVSLVLICSFLPQFLAGPVVGVVIDRFNRKTILIMSDILRGILVLGFLFVSYDHLSVLYVIEFMVFSVSSFFISGKASIIPSITSIDELISANALSQTTWGVMVAVGSFLGGFVIEAFGFETAIIINSVTFFVSAWFIRNIQMPEDVSMPDDVKETVKHQGWTDFKQGVRFILKDRFISTLVLVKPGWAIGGGAVLTLHVVFAEQVFHGGSFEIGILYMCRGLGVVIGSYFGHKLIRFIREDNVLRFIAVAFLLYGLFYGIFSQMPILASAAVMLVIATACSSNLWLFSRVTLQKIVPNHLRGRVFAHDEGLSTLFIMLSSLSAGLGLEYLNPRTVGLIAAALMFGSGVITVIGLLTKILPERSKLS